MSGHGTNSTWKLQRAPDSLVWELAKQRVRDRTTMRKHKENSFGEQFLTQFLILCLFGRQEYIETRTFPENCAAEDTAGSLKQRLGSSQCGLKCPGWCGGSARISSAGLSAQRPQKMVQKVFGREHMFSMDRHLSRAFKGVAWG